MKILSFNTHSLHGGDRADGERVRELSRIISSEKPDLVALQEVNQNSNAEDTDLSFTDGYYRAATCVCPVPFKSDNFLLKLIWQLDLENTAYHFTWLPVKRGYGRYDEGLAVMSRTPITRACGIYLSRTRDYGDWRTRMALLCETEGYSELFCCLHTSRYRDGREQFTDQWEELLKAIEGRERVIVAGDRNQPSDIRGEGYDRVIESGFFDLYVLASEKTGYSYTVDGGIDGWSDGGDGVRRIDHVLTSYIPAADRITYSTVLDGKRGRGVSDHFGVLAEIEGERVDNTDVMKEREW
jgi:maltose 6'-phosphate phosphatase